MQMSLFSENTAINFVNPRSSKDKYSEEYLQSILPAAPTLLSAFQIADAPHNIFTHVFESARTLAEVNAIHAKNYRELRRQAEFSETGKERYDMWFAALWTAETRILEKLYRRTDADLLTKQTGEFFITPDTTGVGKKVCFEYHPDYLGGLNRSTPPTPHFEFKSDQPTEISATGYRSHFLTQIPVAEISDFEDLLIKILRLHLQVYSRIEYNGKIYPKIVDLTKKNSGKAKMQTCQNCGEEFGIRETVCAECGYCIADGNIEFADSEETVEICRLECDRCGNIQYADRDEEDCDLCGNEMTFSSADCHQIDRRDSEEITEKILPAVT